MTAGTGYDGAFTRNPSVRWRRTNAKTGLTCVPHMDRVCGPFCPCMATAWSSARHALGKALRDAGVSLDLDFGARRWSPPRRRGVDPVDESDATERWLALWRSSLTFDSVVLEREWVHVAEREGVVAAVVAVAGEPPTVELSHLWVDPPAMGLGLGRRLLEAAVDYSRRLGAGRLEIVSDPHAEDFYLGFGATRIGEVESEPEGRRLPLLVHVL